MSMFKYIPILEQKTKIPTARQIRMFLKNERHWWTNEEIYIAPIIIYGGDVLTSIDHSLPFADNESSMNYEHKIHDLFDILTKLNHFAMEINYADYEFEQNPKSKKAKDRLEMLEAKRLDIWSNLQELIIEQDSEMKSMYRYVADDSPINSGDYYDEEYDPSLDDDILHKK